MLTFNSNESKEKAAAAARDKRAGILFSIGGGVFLLLTTISEAMYSNFSLQLNAISDLAAIGTKTTIVEETAVLILGVCWSLGAYYLFRNTARRTMLVLNMLPGVGFVIAGLSPENVNVWIHSIGTFAFPLGAVVAILSYREVRSPLKYLLITLGIVSLISTFMIFLGYRVICGTCGYQQGMQQSLLGLGGWESLIVYSLLLWLIAYGSYLLAMSTGGRVQ